ncbi:MAG: hypothetical protein H0Z39_01425 [Peptococcaceae bacterium]|nr:hypothetical protein [Peptococcaceae bacterium]
MSDISKKSTSRRRAAAARAAAPQARTWACITSDDLHASGEPKMKRSSRRYDDESFMDYEPYEEYEAYNHYDEYDEYEDYEEYFEDDFRRPRKGLIAALGDVVRGFFTLRHRPFKGFSTRAVLLVLVLGFMAGMIVQSRYAPWQSVVDAFAAGRKAFGALLEPGMQTALISTAILVAVGIWVMRQVLSASKMHGTGRPARRPAIPKEMLERHR